MNRKTLSAAIAAASFIFAAAAAAAMIWAVPAAALWAVSRVFGIYVERGPLDWLAMAVLLLLLWLAGHGGRSE